MAISLIALEEQDTEVFPYIDDMGTAELDPDKAAADYKALTDLIIALGLEPA